MKRERTKTRHLVAVPGHEPGLIPQDPLSQKAKLRASADDEAIEKVIEELIATSSKVTGVGTEPVADRLIAQVGESLVWPKPKNPDLAVVQAFGAIKEMAPKNITEAMLAAQMIATHDAALRFLQGATRNGQHVDTVERQVHNAARLMRLFAEQVETMQRLKGKSGKQTVTVEHVHIHEGGQAIVGAVNTRSRRGEG